VNDNNLLYILSAISASVGIFLQAIWIISYMIIILNFKLFGFHCTNFVKAGKLDNKIANPERSISEMCGAISYAGALK
jgi:hypothetical protein